MHAVKTLAPANARDILPPTFDVAAWEAGAVLARQHRFKRLREEMETLKDTALKLAAETSNGLAQVQAENIARCLQRAMFSAKIGEQS